MYAVAFGFALAAVNGAGFQASQPIVQLEQTVTPDGWERVGAAEDSIIFMKRVAVVSGRPQVEIRFENLEPVWTGEINARSEVDLYEVDCSTNMGRVIRTTVYTTNNLGGLSRMQVPPSPVLDRGVPGSPFEAAMKAACTGGPPVMETRVASAAVPPAPAFAPAAPEARPSRFARARGTIARAVSGVAGRLRRIINR
jgi:hypothetical protein